MAEECDSIVRVFELWGRRFWEALVHVLREIDRAENVACIYRHLGGVYANVRKLGSQMYCMLLRMGNLGWRGDERLMPPASVRTDSVAGRAEMVPGKLQYIEASGSFTGYKVPNLPKEMLKSRDLVHKGLYCVAVGDLMSLKWA